MKLKKKKLGLEEKVPICSFYTLFTRQEIQEMKFRSVKSTMEVGKFFNYINEWLKYSTT